MLGAALLSLAATGLQVAPRCDLIDIKHHIDGERVAWTQAIAWDWSPQYRRHDAQAWVMIERYRIIPGGVVLYTPSGKSIEVRAGQLQETRSEVDPEVENRKVFPENQRRRVW